MGRYGSLRIMPKQGKVKGKSKVEVHFEQCSDLITSYDKNHKVYGYKNINDFITEFNRIIKVSREFTIKDHYLTKYANSSIPTRIIEAEEQFCKLCELNGLVISFRQDFLNNYFYRMRILTSTEPNNL